MSFTDMRIIDADTHMTERHDLFTERAPKGFEDRVPHVVDVDGTAMWVLEGAPLGPARPGGVIDRNGDKHAFEETKVHGIDWVHQGAWDWEYRLGVMDECGIDTQVVYPNAVGIGGQNLANATQDPVVRRLCVELYNDAMAEVQEKSALRLLPMPVMPAWDIGECAREAERCSELGFRGINMTSDPQDAGSTDLADPAWDALWEVCADLHLPVHFHIGASQTSLTFYGQYYWKSLHENMRPAVGGSMLFLNNARVIINSVYAGIFDRHPKLKMVSVESGIGWIPFILETMDYEILENAPEQAAELNRLPSEYFKDHWWSTFWFEKHQGDLQGLIDRVGEDNVMFETDYPHPTCLYPDPLGTVAEPIGMLRPETQRKVLGDNAAALYRVWFAYARPVGDGGTRYRLAEDAVLGREVREPVEHLDVIEGDTTGIEWVTFQCDEIASVCPITGQPDTNSVTLRYRPSGRLIESKSLKLYLWGFRQRGILVEELAEEIASRVDADIRPDEVEVTVRQSVRGGIVTTVTARAGG